MSLSAVAVAVGLLALAVPLVAWSRKAGIPYPVVLVAVGLVLSFVPSFPQVPLDPSLVLVVFLPPLLYWESFTAPVQEMRDNAGHIWLLAIGLALFTAFAVAVTVHALIPGFTWPYAILFGSIVAPTDELAATVVLERLKIPRYVFAVIEGESLLNDGSALVLYASAVTAITLGGFNLWVEIGRGVLAVIGGAVVGGVVAWLAIAGWRRFQDPELQRTISFIIPFASYTPAQALGLSGVIATVAVGVSVSRWTPVVLRPATRIAGAGYWDTVVFLANVLLYLLLGLQLHSVVTSVTHYYPVATLVRDAVLVNVAIIVIRFAWVVGQEYVPAINGMTKHPEPNPRHALIVAWSGMRGAVSLAAALALPALIGARDVALRDLIVFLSFSVILATLFLGGLTLPFAARVLQQPGEVDDEALETNRARSEMVLAAKRRVAELKQSGSISERDVGVLLGVVASHLGTVVDDGSVRYDGTRNAERLILSAEREALLGLWRRREIDNTVLRSLQRELDLADERLGPPESPEL